MCDNERTDDCFFGNCADCRQIDTETLQETLFEFFIENDICEIRFNCWTTVDRANLEEKVLDTESFVSELFEKLAKLKTHAYIASCQQEAYQKSQEAVQVGEFVIAMDFAENYSFVVQVIRLILKSILNMKLCGKFFRPFYDKNLVLSQDVFNTDRFKCTRLNVWLFFLKIMIFGRCQRHEILQRSKNNHIC